jgi:hypothetical protein
MVRRSKTIKQNAPCLRGHSKGVAMATLGKNVYARDLVADYVKAGKLA